MRLALVCLGLLMSLKSARATPRCRDLDGATVLLTPGRIVLVGEVHGTREMPELFVALACHAAAKGLDVVVGFELPPEIGEAVQRYLSSPGARAERFKIVATRVKFGDGTSSEAMTDAFESLRKLAVETKRVSVFGFMGGPESNGNVGYADGIAAAHRSAPQAVVLALMGNYHNRLTREPDDHGPPVGLLLRQRGLDLKSIWVDFTGGSAHIVGENGPGVYEEPARKGVGKPWTVLPAKSADYDLTISVGRIHASPPATAK